ADSADPVKYWLRNEQGRVWGPYTAEALERLRGQLTGKCEVALDGKKFRPSAEFPELTDLLAPRAPVPAASGATSRPLPASAPPPPAAETPQEVPLDGDLEVFSPARVYAL